MSLAKETCVPCKNGAGKLSTQEITKLLGDVHDWEWEGHELKKRWKFQNFVAAQVFVNQVGTVAEAAKHHPDIMFGWGYAEIRLSTHSVNGLTRNDFILAAKIDELGQNA